MAEFYRGFFEVVGCGADVGHHLIGGLGDGGDIVSKYGGECFNVRDDITDSVGVVRCQYQFLLSIPEPECCRRFDR